jgi:hypothetical protein
MKAWLKKALRASTPSSLRRRRARAVQAATAVTQVTLIVYGWHSVEPGTLAWVFPSLAAAMIAVRAMKNAVKWAIVIGRREAQDVDVDVARARGWVLAEAV